MIHRQLQDDVNHDVLQYTRKAAWPAHIPSVFAQIMHEQMRHSMQMERFEINKVL
jgi:peptide methionine sulfoxide reductase MsrB